MAVQRINGLRDLAQPDLDTRRVLPSNSSESRLKCLSADPGGSQSSLMYRGRPRSWVLLGRRADRVPQPPRVYLLRKMGIIVRCECRLRGKLRVLGPDELQAASEYG
jgi:hypothetical protein